MKRILLLLIVFGLLVFARQAYFKSHSVGKQKGMAQSSKGAFKGTDGLVNKTFVYESYSQKTGEVLDKFVVNVSELPLGRKLVRWNFYEGNTVNLDEITLDANYSTLGWKVKADRRNADYVGRREGNELVLRGTQKGEVIDKRIRLNDLPFYFNPKISLVGFVTSNIKKIKFWSLRKDILEKHLMKAEKTDVQTIDVNGKATEVIKVYFAATGIGERFFNRTYYFRKSDGVFVTQDFSNGWKSHLISEESVRH